MQWAYGTNANWDDGHIGPIEYNSQSQHVPHKFWMRHRLRSEAEEVWRRAQANEAWSRLECISETTSHFPCWTMGVRLEDSHLEDEKEEHEPTSEMCWTRQSMHGGTCHFGREQVGSLLDAP